MLRGAAGNIRGGQGELATDSSSNGSGSSSSIKTHLQVCYVEQLSTFGEVQVSWQVAAAAASAPHVTKTQRSSSSSSSSSTTHMQVCYVERLETFVEVKLRA
jgi:hypothetical protein